jgi:cold shock CspA family protein
MQGEIIKVVAERGFAFARINGEHHDVFCHANSFQPPLEFGEHLLGERVELEIVDAPAGPRARIVSEIEWR